MDSHSFLSVPLGFFILAFYLLIFSPALMTEQFNAHTSPLSDWRTKIHPLLSVVDITNGYVMMGLLLR